MNLLAETERLTTKNMNSWFVCVFGGYFAFPICKLHKGC